MVIPTAEQLAAFRRDSNVVVRGLYNANYPPDCKRDPGREYVFRV